MADTGVIVFSYGYRASLLEHVSDDIFAIRTFASSSEAQCRIPNVVAVIRNLCVWLKWAYFLSVSTVIHHTAKSTLVSY